MSVLGSVSSGCSHVKYIYDIAVLFIRMAFSQTIAPLLNDQSKVEEDNSLIEFDSEEFSQPRRLYRCRGNYLNISQKQCETVMKVPTRLVTARTDGTYILLQREKKRNNELCRPFDGRFTRGRKSITEQTCWS